MTESHEEMFCDSGNQSSSKVNLEINSTETTLSHAENVCPSKQLKPSYEATPTLKNTLPGTIFQVDLLMLFIKRALDKRYEFTIATEMADADKFDDIVYKYTDRSGQKLYRFFQAKHRTRAIGVNDLVTTSKSNDDFALPIYFISFCKIKNNPLFQDGILKDFIICTNSDFNFTDENKSGVSHKRLAQSSKWRSYIEYELLSKDDILHVRNGVKINRFVKTKLPSIIEDIRPLFEKALKDYVDKIKNKLKLKQDEEIKNKLNHELKIFDNLDLQESLKEFFESITFITNYLNETDLAEVIRNEIGEEFNLLNRGFVNDTFKMTIIDWLKEFNREEKTAPFFTDEDGRELFEGIKNLIYSIMLTGVSCLQTRKLDGYDIGFEENLVAIDNFLNDKSNKILFICSNWTRLTAIKVWQTLNFEAIKQRHTYLGCIDGYLFVNFDTFSVMLDVIVKSICNQQYLKLLIIEWDETVDNKLTPGEFQKFNEIIVGKIEKLILIINNKNNLSSKFDVNSTRISDDKMNFDDLDRYSKHGILNKRLTLQGKRTSLGNLVNDDIMNDLVDGEILSCFIERKGFNVGSKLVFDLPEYYVERDLFMQNITVKDLIDLRYLSTILLITGITTAELLNYGVRLHEIFEWRIGELKQFDKKNVIILPVDPPSDMFIFSEMIEFNRKNETNWVCWLEYDVKSTTFYVKNSNELMLSYSDEILERMKSFNYVHRFLKRFTSMLNQPSKNLIILAAEPGDGKSLFLNSVAKKIKNISLVDDWITSWIVRVNLNDFADCNKTPNLNGIRFSVKETEKAVDYLLKMVEKGKDSLLGERLFKAVMKKRRYKSRLRVVILFDGFDEICPTYKKKTLDLIGALTNSMVALICVTTRFNKADDIIKVFQPQVYKFLPLTFEEQINIICSFFKHSIFGPEKTRSRSKIKVTENIWALLQEIESSLKELLDYGQSQQCQIFTVPGLEISLELEYIQNCYSAVSKLLSKYSGEKLYEKSVKSFQEDLIDFLPMKLNLEIFLRKWGKSTNGNNENSFTKTPFNLILLAEVFLENKFRMPDKLNLIQLYSKFVKKKFSVYFYEKSGSNAGNVVQKNDCNTLNSYYQELHEELALLELDLIQQTPKLNDYRRERKNKTTNADDELSRIGLIKIEGGKTYFIHRSWAEYFVSRYIFRNIDKKIAQQLFKKILTEERFVLVRKFFNCILELICLGCHKITAEHNQTIKKHVRKLRNSLCPFDVDDNVNNLEVRTSNGILDWSVKEGLIELVKYIIFCFKGNKRILIEGNTILINSSTVSPGQLAQDYSRPELSKLFDDIKYN